VTSTEPVPRTGALAALQDRAEEWIYRLNEKEHWFFRLYDACNEVWARLVFGGIHRRAAGFERPVQTRTGAEAHVRLLLPADLEAFTELLAAFDFRYRPPHPLDRESAAKALTRRSYLPWGIFVEGRLVGYLLLRLFFPRRAVTGIWTLPDTYNLGLAQESLRQTASFTTAEGLADYATVPVDNLNSVRVAVGAGWVILRSNRRFHVLRHP